MSKIHKPQQNNKINKAINENRGCVSEQFPWFSFRFMTANSHYSFDNFNGKDKNETEKTLSGLYRKLEELSKKPWVYWMQQPKRIGLETINYEQLNFSPGADADISKDTTMYVFRFDTYRGTNAGRIIGYKISPCAVFHIIGYDFDFTAYSHS